MWTIIKFDKKKLTFLKEDLKNKFGSNYFVYSPKLLIKKYKNNKTIKKEINILGDYILCYHKDFENREKTNKLKFCRGLKYLLNGFRESQNEIEEFVNKCKEFEDKDGYLTQSFYQLNINKKYKFISGPFSEKIFEIINLQKNKIEILMGNLKTKINKKEFLFNPV